MTPKPEAPADQVRERKFSLGDRVRKKSGSSWHGYVVGFYDTDLTAIGYAIESERETGSVQIYPESALEPYSGPPQPTPSDGERGAVVDDVRSTLAWLRHQAGSIMEITAGCSLTHGDDGGGLEMANSMASDIMVNIDMLADRLHLSSDAGERG